MRKKVLFLAVLILSIAFVAFVYFYSTDFTLSIPDETKYIITYSSGSSKKEVSYINYIDENGDLVRSSRLNAKVNLNGIEEAGSKAQINLFTHEQIYFGDGTTLPNKEMAELYDFSSKDGLDEVYCSGYIEKLNMFYKHVPHGLAYDIEEYGFFDLLILYNENTVYNIPIVESGSIAIDYKTGNIYNFFGDEGNKIYYELIQFNVDQYVFTKSEGSISLSGFIDENTVLNTYFIGKSLIVDSSVYQVLHIGEGNMMPYLMEYEINNSQSNVFYSESYPMNFGEGYLGLATTTALYGDEIVFYSEVNPNKIITFDTNDKSFQYEPFWENIAADGTNPFHLKTINGSVYAMLCDIDGLSYDIYQITQDNTFVHIFKGKLPETKGYTDLWVVDFHVLQ